MAGMDTKQIILIGVIAVLALYIVIQYDPTLFGLLGRRGYEGFAASAKKPATGMKAPLNMKMANSTGASAMGSMQGGVGQTATQPNVSATPSAKPTGATPYTVDPKVNGPANVKKAEGFADLASMEGPASFSSAETPAGCYPRDQLTPVELLPADQNTIYAQQNPMGTGSLKGKNFLSAGALIGVNTVGQSLRNANLQLRSEPPNPQTPVSIFLQSTIQPDISHRPLEVGA